MEVRAQLRWHRRRVAGPAIAVATVLVLTSTPASASVTVAAIRAESATAPETATASDGSRVFVASRATVTGVSGFVGTGVPIDPKATAPSGASTTAIGIDSIFGSDDRIQISPATSYPARAVVQITRNGAAHCTGWLYGPDVVATAGHCVHSGGGDGDWYTGLAVWPGRNGSFAPYGSCAARQLYSVTGWTVNGNEAYDYGAIKLNCSIGNTVGWFGYWWQSASLTGARILINGYPGDKPFGTQWRGDRVARAVAVSRTNQIFYRNDTTGGMSGSPIYQIRPAGSPFCTGYCAMGIHAYGFPHGDYPHDTYNHGTRITEARFNNLIAWRDAP